MMHVERITSIVKLNLKLQCYSQVAYILVKGTITITRGPTGTDAAARQADEGNKGVTFKKHHSLTA